MIYFSPNPMAAQTDHFSTKGVKKNVLFLCAPERAKMVLFYVYELEGGRLREYEVNKYVGVQGGWVDSNAQGIKNFKEAIIKIIVCFLLPSCAPRSA